MRILVTGATGFLGNVVSRRLSDLGHEVYGLSHSGKSPKGCFCNFTLISGDLLDSIQSVLQRYKFEGLVHLAWVTTPGVYWNSAENIRWIRSSLHLVEAFVKYGGQRIFVAGSSAEYYWSGEGLLHEKETPQVPNSLYGVSKNALNKVLYKWSSEAGFSLAWGYLFNIFGPHEHERRLIPSIVGRLNRNEFIPFDSGMIYRDFIHVDDASDAISHLFLSDVEGGVNIGIGDIISVRDVLRKIEISMGLPGHIKFDSIPVGENELKYVVPSVNSLSTEVGWKPTYSIDQRIRETCEWLIRK